MCFPSWTVSTVFLQNLSLWPRIVPSMLRAAGSNIWPWFTSVTNKDLLSILSFQMVTFSSPYACVCVCSGQREELELFSQNSLQKGSLKQALSLSATRKHTDVLFIWTCLYVCLSACKQCLEMSVWSLSVPLSKVKSELYICKSKDQQCASLLERQQKVCVHGLFSKNTRIWIYSTTTTKIHTAICTCTNQQPHF